MTMDRNDSRRRWLALILLCGGTLMIVLDTTIVNVALPSIRQSLGFSETSLAWVVNAYLLTFGGFLLLGGRLGDLFGHRRLFLIGIALFTLASLACGLANTQHLLIVARAVQGLGGAIVSAVSLSLIMTMFTEPGERAKAMGVFGFVAAGGGTVGVLLGGILTDVLDWHWIFIVNLPVGIAVFAFCFVLLPSGRGPAGVRLDVAGAVTVTAALMCAVYAIVNGNQAGWTSAQTLGLLGASVVLLLAFLGIEAKVASPLVPLSLFRLRDLTTANVIAVLWAAGMFAWFFLSALYLQIVLGYSPLRVGLAFLPTNLIMGAFSLGLSAKLVMRFGIRRPLSIGLSLAAVGLLLFARAPVGGSYVVDVLPSMILLAFGAGIVLQPAAARGDERRRAGRGRPGIGRREHRLHDGRRARPRRARDPRGAAHREPARRGRELAGRAERRVPPCLPGRRGVHARRRRDRRHRPAGRDAGARRGQRGDGPPRRGRGRVLDSRRWVPSR